MKFFGLIAILLMGMVNVSHGEECSVDNLPAGVVADLDKYDKALYKESACLGKPPLPAQCNYMGLAEDCSCCFTTCEGANKYLADYLEDIDEWGAVTSEFINVLINFCPDGEVDSMDKCPITYTDTRVGGPTV